MKLPLTDIVPRMSRMVSEPKAMIPALGVSAVAGLIEGLALAAVLPAISSLAADEAWWGLSTGGWLIVFAVLSLCSVGCNFLMNKLNYAVALDFLRSIPPVGRGQGVQAAAGMVRTPVGGTVVPDGLGGADDHR